MVKLDATRCEETDNFILDIYGCWDARNCVSRCFRTYPPHPCKNKPESLVRNLYHNIAVLSDAMFHEAAAQAHASS